MSDPIDLRATFGKKYIVRYEESRIGNEREPALYIIPCRLGHCYAHSATEIGVAVDSHPKLAQRIARLPGVRILQLGEDGMNAAFDVARWPEVAKIMRPRRRRLLSPAAKANRRAALAKATGLPSIKTRVPAA